MESNNLPNIERVLQTIADRITPPLGGTVQFVYLTSAGVASGSTTIPLDDTIPQNTEGNEFMTLAITPKSATNVLEIEVHASLNPSVAVNVIGALFQDTTANALAANRIYMATNGGGIVLPIRYVMVAGTTSEITFKFRAGGSTASTITLNGGGGTREFGTASKSLMTIREYKA